MIGYFTNCIGKWNFLGSFRNTFIDICKCSKCEAWTWQQKIKGVYEKIPPVKNQTEVYYSGNGEAGRAIQE